MSASIRRAAATRRRLQGPPGKAVYDAKTAPAEGTPLALTYLESYLDGKSNRKRSTMALLGCSERTAKRIVSRSTPYRAPMKLEWVDRICRAVGKPTSDILNTRATRSWKECLMGWNHARTVAEALQFATDCALSIVYWAMHDYHLLGNFQISYESGRPDEVIVYLSPAPELQIYGGKYGMHRIVVTSERVPPGGNRRMYVHYFLPNGDQVMKDFLTPANLKKIFKEIHALTKDITAEFQRETAAAAATAQSG